MKMVIIGATAMGLMILFYVYVLIQFNRELRSVRKARSRLTPWPPLLRHSATPILATVAFPVAKSTISASSNKSEVVVLSTAKAAFSARQRAKGSF
jgi:hypothetical protein